MTTKSTPPDDHEAKLEQVLADYVRSAERGQPLDRQQLIDRHPDLADDLQSFFRNRDAMEQLAEPVQELAPTIGLDAEQTDGGGNRVRYFGDYELVEEIARGGMGVVYKARQVNLKRIVALKMILAGQLASDTDVQRFHAEAEAAAKLDHPNIVPIFEIGQHEGQHYFSMAFVDGESLTREVAEGVFPPQEAAAVVRKVAQAIAYAHVEGVIHRDLKPANVLMDQDGQPRVTDFGLAKRVEAESGLTATGQVLGTPSYMPPEQASGETDQIGPLSDVYSLGAILYCLLTGRPPFQAANPLDTLMQVLEREPVSPRQLNPNVPKDLETICLKCLEKDRRRRYASAQALVDELQRFLNGEPIQARPISRPARAWRWCRRKPALATANALAVVATIVTLVILAVAVVRERGLRQRAEWDSARLLYDQSCTKCVQQDSAQGMLWLSRNLVKAENTGAPVEKSVRRQLAAWSRETHALQRVFPMASDPPCGHVRAVAYSPDGETIATAVAYNYGTRGAISGWVILWDVQTGKQVGKVQHASVDPIWALAISPDGKLLLTGCDDRTAQLWDLDSTEPVGTPFQHEGSVASVAFSPDGKRVLTGSVDNTAQVWDLKTGTPAGSPLLHQDRVTSVAFSPNGEIILTGSADKTALLWDAKSSTPIAQPMTHEDEVTCVAFSPLGNAILTGSADRKARLWDAKNGNQIGLPIVHQDEVTAVAISPDGSLLLTMSGPLREPVKFRNTTRLWDVETRKPVGPPMLHETFVDAAVFSPDGKLILTGCWNDTAYLWEVRSERAFAPRIEHTSMIRAAAISPDGRTVLTGSNDKTARLWDAQTGNPVGSQLEHDGEVSAVTFSPNGTTALTGSRDHTARLWEVRTCEPLGSPLEHDDEEVLSVAFSPDGKHFVTGTGERARLWETQTRKLIRVLPPKTSKDLLPSDHVAFSPDGVSILTNIGLWNPHTGKPAHRRSLLDPHADFGPDGTTIVVAGGARGGSRSATIMNLQTRTVIGRPMVHHFKVNSVAFSPDGDTVLTGAGRFAQIWDVSTGKQVGRQLEHPAQVTIVAFSRNGKTALVGGGQTVRLWNVPRPVGGKADRIALWTSVMTGMELDDDGNASPLQAQHWQERRRHLDQLGDAHLP